MSMPPVVYVGPSLNREAVRNHLPKAQVMRPVRRGDLYRDRMLGFKIFVILDGIFFENCAISPREIIDVLGDGGTVVGAASMGAIRAAECWPSGMHGVGTIFRLFRRGVLTSDDEVAVAFFTEPPYEAASVPLVNIRYAISRAVRAQVLKPEDAVRIVRAATSLHYSERTWGSILRGVGSDDVDSPLMTLLDYHDLKRLDAIRALHRVRRWITADPEILTDDGRRHIHRAFTPRREGPFEADRRRGVSVEALWRWLLASGRYRRYAADVCLDGGVAAGLPAGSHDSSVAFHEKATSLHDKFLPINQSIGRLGIEVQDVSTALRRQLRWTNLATLSTSSKCDFARQVLANVACLGDIDRVLLRFEAFRRAVDRARSQKLVATSAHWAIARRTITYSHGFRTWEELKGAIGHHAVLWSWIEGIAEETALSKAVRDTLFHVPRSRTSADILDVELSV